MQPQLPNSDPIIVLEAGATHNGELSQALEMIDAAVKAGVTAIKFQTVWAGNIAPYRDGSLDYRDDTGPHRRRIVDMLRERELNWESWYAIDNYAHRAGMLWFSTPDMPTTAKMLGNVQGSGLIHEFRCAGIKIAGADMGRSDLVAAASHTRLRMLLDTRGGREELESALRLCREFRDDPIVVHTPTGYPTVDPGLSRIADLREEYPDLVIGFTSHSPGFADCKKAVEMGAGYVEKGITLSRKQPGIEHITCLEPDELVGFVGQMREIYRWQPR
jgi:N,N'-diacetyllegionaminate synthase